ncbi:Type 2A phosphatase-associated protein 42 [Tilletia horrida]|uniref:Type 2A phosphatase-associated protein 42 n=1 Tax=Tilletia horrida TaxID=155126 RepID=A0AAN6GNB2_9BASI|nr:Type 2A phosphatase-associated protein 42 [Tilletia horrida]KAK0566309.1 Type 2A phosphatase-associated protein 42 [Tilletia horrida]
MADSESNASFTTLLARACSAASSGSGHKDEEAILNQFLHLNRLAQSLNLISINEELRDISTPSLRALFLPSLLATAYTQQRSTPTTSSTESPFEARKMILRNAQEQAKAFLSSITKLNILPPSTLSLLNARNNQSSQTSSSSFSSSSAAANAAQSRQLKIALFKLERSLQSALDTYRTQARAAAAKRRGNSARAPAAGIQSTSAPGTEADSAPEDAFYDLLILGGGAADDEDEEEEEDDGGEENSNGREVTLATIGSSGSSSSAAPPPPPPAAQPTSLRSYLLLNLNLHALKTYALLESAQQELTLLANMPPQDSLRESQQRQEQRERTRGPNGDVSWKLDAPIGGGLSSAPLLDPKGRPLRPFTITPSTGSAAAGAGVVPLDPTAHRAALKQQVFQPSHRLPTMSIDDYLAEEERRGNVLRGGGPEGAAKPTPKEERAIRAELDGTVQGWGAEEEERQEKIKWDKWADEHRRGEGNTMNRG